MSARDNILAGLRVAEASTVGDATAEDLLEAHRAEVLREAANAVLGIRSFEKTFSSSRAAAQVSENIGLLDAARLLERMAAGGDR
ncbi:hypothetical protein [Streptomyces albireticuli]|uniref:Uncharacterized protein n=1 Tax=Streptomyces albireticuli TaxID=1940 RepID=A0A2A2D7G9_9ACTN|nr:hypothetical protein [Streptomyces albireticuli]MCD9194256.1 hypothetical protein [Streptomyces albireticuli]PAU47387.1 hypothetical protein CK936_19070 [Streptomyces albireticuli]